MRCKNHHSVLFELDPSPCVFCGETPFLESTDFVTHPELGLAKETRQSQITLTQLIADNMRDGKILMGEAPTGVGKSFASLLPPIVDVTETVLIVTAKKSLCTQYEYDDLPYLQEMVGARIPFEHMVMYGKNSYACKALVMNEVETSEIDEYDSLLTKTQWGRWDEVDNARLYRSDLTAENCNASKCEYKAECGYIRARKQLEAARIIVVNPWLWGYDIKMRLESNRGFLGNYRHVIVDEAHKVHDGLRAAFSYDISDKFLARALAKAEKQGISLTNPETAVALWDKMFESLIWQRKRTRQDNVAPETIKDVANELMEHLLRLQRNVETALDAQTIPNPLHGYNLRGRLETAVSCINTLYDTDPGNKRVCYLDYDYGSYHLKSVPVSVGPIIQGLRTREVIGSVTNPHTQQSSHTNVPQIKSMAFISATLAVGGSMRHYAHSVGIPHADVTETILPSSFNFKKQALLYTSNTVPLPTREEGKKELYQEALAEEIKALIEANNGNALILFTARDHMEAVHDILVGETKIPLVVQNSNQPASVALQRFQATPNSVLFGLKSFFEGINIPGTKLSLVVLTCLPFPGRSDLVIQALRESAGDKWFHQVDLPMCELDTRQACGRLIRTINDVGVVAVLDSRIVKKRYGGRLRKSIGIPNVTKNLPAAVKTLQSIRARKAE